DRRSLHGGDGTPVPGSDARRRHGQDHQRHPQGRLTRADALIPSAAGVGYARLSYRRSRIVAVAIAPPAHMVISAVDASRRSISCTAVVIRRAPVLPTG